MSGESVESRKWNKRKKMGRQTLLFSPIVHKNTSACKNISSKKLFSGGVSPEVYAKTYIIK